MTPIDDRPTRREPVLNAPWPPLLLLLIMLLVFLFQRTVDQPVWLNLAFAPAMLGLERPWTMVTTQFLHGGWMHFLLMSAGVLAFGTPVARLFGLDLRGGVLFFLFFLVCGVVGLAGFSALHLDSWAPALGVSVAMSGLTGAAGRLIEKRGELGSPWGRVPLTFALAWTGVNALTGLAPLLLGPGMKIAWEAHIIGFFAGMFLVGVFARFARPVYSATH
ncbi:rhomboid family intramembrane serine protease [Caulobacter mirabilis]|uniref:Rhomboid family intramembrane serine protease n=1 Tax=Caulobacter mirabilis TaxID=69666 RepID=A0A2D2B0Y6_9CAUL|nr:rhomboid family intramembrane serine protease [Caulobacter mirabilis]ATQ43913.1 rhomboid family intramembrane serine protease [Caulobacter mirabilis]